MGVSYRLLKTYGESIELERRESIITEQSDKNLITRKRTQVRERFAHPSAVSETGRVKEGDTLPQPLNLIKRSRANKNLIYAVEGASYQLKRLAHEIDNEISKLKGERNSIMYREKKGKKNAGIQNDTKSRNVPVKKAAVGGANNRAVGPSSEGNYGESVEFTIDRYSSKHKFVCTSPRYARDEQTSCRPRMRTIGLQKNTQRSSASNAPCYTSSAPSVQVTNVEQPYNCFEYGCGDGKNPMTVGNVQTQWQQPAPGCHRVYEHYNTTGNYNGLICNQNTYNEVATSPCSKYNYSCKQQQQIPIIHIMPDTPMCPMGPVSPNIGFCNCGTCCACSRASAYGRRVSDLNTEDFARRPLSPDLFPKWGDRGKDKKTCKQLQKEREKQKERDNLKEKLRQKEREREKKRAKQLDEELAAACKHEEKAKCDCEAEKQHKRRCAELERELREKLNKMSTMQLQKLLQCVKRQEESSNSDASLKEYKVRSKEKFVKITVGKKNSKKKLFSASSGADSDDKLDCSMETIRALKQMRITRYAPSKSEEEKHKAKSRDKKDKRGKTVVTEYKEPCDLVDSDEGELCPCKKNLTAVPSPTQIEICKLLQQDDARKPRPGYPTKWETSNVEPDGIGYDNRQTQPDSRRPLQHGQAPRMHEEDKPGKEFKPVREEADAVIKHAPSHIQESRRLQEHGQVPRMHEEDKSSKEFKPLREDVGKPIPAHIQESRRLQEHVQGPRMHEEDRSRKGYKPVREEADAVGKPVTSHIQDSRYDQRQTPAGQRRPEDVYSVKSLDSPRKPITSDFRHGPDDRVQSSEHRGSPTYRYPSDYQGGSPSYDYRFPKEVRDSSPRSDDRRYPKDMERSPRYDDRRYPRDGKEASPRHDEMRKKQLDVSRLSPEDDKTTRPLKPEYDKSQLQQSDVRVQSRPEDVQRPDTSQGTTIRPMPGTEDFSKHESEFLSQSGRPAKPKERFDQRSYEKVSPKRLPKVIEETEATELLTYPPTAESTHFGEIGAAKLAPCIDKIDRSKVGRPRLPDSVPASSTEGPLLSDMRVVAAIYGGPFTSASEPGRKSPGISPRSAKSNVEQKETGLTVRKIDDKSVCNTVDRREERYLPLTLKELFDVVCANRDNITTQEELIDYPEGVATAANRYVPLPQKHILDAINESTCSSRQPSPTRQARKKFDCSQVQPQYIVCPPCPPCPPCPSIDKQARFAEPLGYPSECCQGQSYRQRQRFDSNAVISSGTEADCEVEEIPLVQKDSIDWNQVPCHMPREQYVPQIKYVEEICEESKIYNDGDNMLYNICVDREEYYNEDVQIGYADRKQGICGTLAREDEEANEDAALRGGRMLKFEKNNAIARSCFPLQNDIAIKSSKLSDDDLRFPEYTGCPCMYETYLNLMSLYTGKNGNTY